MSTKGVEYSGVPSAVVPGAIEIPASAPVAVPGSSAAGAYTYYYKTGPGQVTLATGTAAVVILNSTNTGDILVVNLPSLAVATQPVYVKVHNKGQITAHPTGSEKIELLSSDYAFRTGSPIRGMLLPDKVNGTWWLTLLSTI